MTAEAREQLLAYIQRPATRTSLHAYVRRRGLDDSADDLVQTVLCDALTASAVPERSSELPRFVTAIARNKVVDERRRRSRWKSAELPEQLEARGNAPNSAEARELLSRIERDVVATEERRALSWLVREHEGDSLYLLALEQALEPSTLRQRICRLRKSLRARYLAPLALALGLGTAWATLPLSLPPPATSTSPVFAGYFGDWQVLEVAPAKYAGLAQHVHIDSSGVRVFGPSEALGRQLSLQYEARDRVTLRSGSNVWHAQLEPLGGGRLRITTPRGSVVLERSR